MTWMFLALMLTAAAAEPGAYTATLLDGSAVEGRLVAWDGEGVTLETADGTRTLASDELLATTSEAAASTATTTAKDAERVLYAELTDGSRILLTSVTVADRVATIATPQAAAPLSVPVDAIRRIDLQHAAGAEALWQDLDARELAGDVLMVLKREGEQLDYLTGVAGDVTADEVVFEWDGDRVPVKRAKVAAIQYYHAAAAELPSAVCRLALADGAEIAAHQIELGAGGMLNVTTPAEVQLLIPVSQVARADYSSGKLAYLSDLTPTGVQWMPRIATPRNAALIAGYGMPREDSSFSGGPLTLTWSDESSPTGRDVRNYAKGVALRSRTEANYRLPPGMTRFVATAGIDPATASEGHVVLEIRADDRVLWEGEIDGRRPPVQIDVPLAAARRLHLRVEYGRNLDYGDRLHLVEARVTK